MVTLLFCFLELLRIDLPEIVTEHDKIAYRDINIPYRVKGCFFCIFVRFLLNQNIIYNDD